MKIVIDIPKDDFERIKNTSFVENTETMLHQSSEDRKSTMMLFRVMDAIQEGIPLPEHHGDLISKEQAIELVEFYQLNPQHFDFVNLIDEIKDEKPIIEESDNE